jgi:transcriptional regulator with XRE-family HTH domain
MDKGEVAGMRLITMSGDYTDAETLRELYVEQDLTQDEIAGRFDVSGSTISNWVRKHGIEKRNPWDDEERLRELYWDEGLSIQQVADRLGTYPDVIHRAMDRLGVERRPGPQAEYPWHDPDRLRELYHEEGLSQRQIAGRLGTTQGIISKWMIRHGIETREFREAGADAVRVNRAAYRTTESGYEMWRARVGDKTLGIQVHRLVAIAENGFDAVDGNVVHHENNIPWDNRPSNLRVMGDAEHKRLHAEEREEHPFHG